MTKTIREARNFFRFCLQYRDFLRNTISLVEAQNIVRQRLENRNENFLRVVKDQVFSNPKSPYLPLMRAAHCELGDLEKMVSTDGLEPTLLELRREGVYVAFEEYKGRRPLVRHGREIPIQPEDFGNTNLIGVLKAETSGSTGAPRQVHVHVNHLAAQAPASMLSFEAHGFLDRPVGIWLGILPIASGTNRMLRSVKHGPVSYTHLTLPTKA